MIFPHVTYATQSAPGVPNEDYVTAGPNWVVLLDGATAPPGIASGCVHNVVWVVSQLAGALASGLTTSRDSLPDVLSSAIEAVCAAHADTCDLANPASPSSTVALFRILDDVAEYLVLCDNPLLLKTVNGLTPITDDRVARLSIRTYEQARELRNQPEGFWVASTKPEAAYQALHGKVPVDQLQRVALLSDGASRYIDRLKLGDWKDLLEVLDNHSPAELIRQVRAAEFADVEAGRTKGPRDKPHDDATAVLLRF